jgi:hypothetical protein
VPVRARAYLRKKGRCFATVCNLDMAVCVVAGMILNRRFSMRLQGRSNWSRLSWCWFERSRRFGSALQIEPNLHRRLKARLYRIAHLNEDIAVALRAAALDDHRRCQTRARAHPGLRQRAIENLGCGGTAEALVRADTLLGWGLGKVPGICDFEPASFLRLYKIARPGIDGSFRANPRS